MRALFTIMIAASVLTGAAFALEPPSPEIVERFFRSRLTPTSRWCCTARCEILSGGDTIANKLDSAVFVDSSEIPIKFSFEQTPYSLGREDFFTPLKLARSDFDSIAINKTRVRFSEIMCWKARIFAHDKSFEVLLSGDGFFRLMQMELKTGGKANSRDVWSFREVEKGKDLPIKLTRSVEFGWGEEKTSIVSSVELSDLRKADRSDTSPQ